MTNPELICIVLNFILTLLSLLASIGPFRSGLRRTNGQRKPAALYASLINEATQVAFALILVVAIVSSWPQSTMTTIDRLILLCRASLEVRLSLFCLCLHFES